MPATTPPATARRLGLAGLAAIVAAAALLPAVAAFLYPLELETREGTGWLYVLAMSADVDIYDHSRYDHSRVTFVNMCFGPFDPLLKFWLHRLLPDLPGWQLMRLPVLALPIAMMGLPIFFQRKRDLESVALCVVLGAFGYLLLVSNWMGTMMLTSRPDATTHLLAAVLLMLLWASCRCRRLISLAATATAAGAVAAFAYDTQWRIAPFLAFAAIAWLGMCPPANRWIGIMSGITGFACAFVLVLGLSVHFDLNLFWQHFYFFYLPQSGWGANPGAGALPFINLWHLSLLPLMVAAGFVFLWRISVSAPAEKRLLQARYFLAAFALLLVGLVAAYMANAAAGGVYYINPIFIPLWFFGALLLANEMGTAEDRAWFKRGIAFCGVILLLTNTGWLFLGRGPFLDAASMLANRAMAMRVTEALRQIDATHHVVSEDLFLWKSRYAGEVVDMGDTVEGIARANGFGPTFTATAERYFADLRRHPPAIVLKGMTASLALNQILSEQPYTCAYCGTRTLLANGSRPGFGLSIYALEPVDKEVADQLAFAPLRVGYDRAGRAASRDSNTAGQPH